MLFRRAKTSSRDVSLYREITLTCLHWAMCRETRSFSFPKLFCKNCWVTLRHPFIFRLVIWQFVLNNKARSWSVEPRHTNRFIPRWHKLLNSRTLSLLCRTTRTLSREMEYRQRPSSTDKLELHFACL